MEALSASEDELFNITLVVKQFCITIMLQIC